MYGTAEWLDLVAARDAGRLTAADLRDELGNLMRWRLEQDLGYRQTHEFRVVNTTGQEIYRLIFATDHDAGDRIMWHIYGKAAREQPQMRRAALEVRRERRREERGEGRLFDDSPADLAATVPDEELYEHTPPHPPLTR